MSFCRIVTTASMTRHCRTRLLTSRKSRSEGWGEERGFSKCADRCFCLTLKALMGSYVSGLLLVSCRLTQKFCSWHSSFLDVYRSFCFESTRGFSWQRASNCHTADKATLHMLQAHSHSLTSCCRTRTLQPSSCLSSPCCTQVGIINASPLSMGLLTPQGPPDWHPAPPELKEAAQAAADYCRDQGVDIAKLALQFAVR